MLNIPREAYMVAVTCNFCGKPFLARSKKARFHSAACKQRFYRWRKKLPATGEKLAGLVKEVGTYLDYDQSRVMALEVLRQVQDQLLDEPKRRDIHFVR